MRRIVRHPKYQETRNDLADKNPDILPHLDRLENRIAESPHWPTSFYLVAYDCWWSHLLVDDETIPHMRVFHAFDDDEVRFLAIVPADETDSP